MTEALLPDVQSGERNVIRSETASMPATARETGPPSSSARVSKRRRGAKGNTEEARLARKRELDRIAQRNSRVKTKAYIEHLEQTVEACKASTEADLVKTLLSRNNHLQVTNRRLRKILSDMVDMIQIELQTCPIKAVEGEQDETADLEELEGMPNVVVPSDHNNPTFINPSHGVSCKVPSATDVLASSWNEGFSTRVDAHNLEIMDKTHEPANELPTDALDQSLDTMYDKFVDARSSSGDSRAHHMSEEDFNFACLAYAYEPLNAMSFASPMALYPIPTQEMAGMWDTTDFVFGKIFRMPAGRAAYAKTFDRGTIFRAIRNGWNSLEPYLLQHPIIEIVKEYDHLVTERLDKVNRVAIAYKNSALLKVCRVFQHGCSAADTN